MIRQARGYLLGAMSGATLIAIAVVVFVLLVSTAVLRDWPIAGLVGGGDEAAVSVGQPVAADEAAGAGGAADGPAGRDGAGARGGDGDRPGADSPTGGGPGSVAPQPGGGGGEALGTGGGSTPTSSPGPTSGGSDGGATSGGGGGSSGGGGGGDTASSPSSEVTGAVNDTVDQVDQTVTDGALEESGVTGATEEAVNGVAGPESPVGKVVDEAAGAVEGALGGNR